MASFGDVGDGLRVRPYAITGGRTRSRAELPVEAIVYRTPANDPVAVKQAVDPKRAWLVASTAEGVEQGTVSVAGATWRVFRAEDKGQVAVVQDGPGTGDLTTVVLGQAPQADVEALAAALRPSPLSGPGSTP